MLRISPNPKLWKSRLASSATTNITVGICTGRTTGNIKQEATCFYFYGTECRIRNTRNATILISMSNFFIAANSPKLKKTNITSVPLIVDIGLILPILRESSYHRPEFRSRRQRPFIRVDSLAPISIRFVSICLLFASVFDGTTNCK